MAQEVHPDGRRAVTHYRVIRTAGSLSLLELRLDTGRTHQIRVHMAHLGCPLVGDFLYGREGALGRPALHSAHAAFDHPITGERLTFSLPLPHDLAVCFNGTHLLS